MSKKKTRNKKGWPALKTISETMCQVTVNGPQVGKKVGGNK